jgi:hypothetical protein
MKTLLTLLVLVLAATTTFAQTEKTLTKSLALNETHTAFVMLPGDVSLTTWDENFLRVTTTIQVANMSENIVKRLVVVGRYSIETKEDKFGKMMVIKMPKVAHYVAVQGVDLVESYDFKIQAPKGYKVVVKEDLNPTAPQNATLGQAI